MSQDVKKTASSRLLPKRLFECLVGYNIELVGFYNGVLQFALSSWNV